MTQSEKYNLSLSFNRIYFDQLINFDFFFYWRCDMVTARIRRHGAWEGLLLFAELYNRIVVLVSAYCNDIAILHHHLFIASHVAATKRIGACTQSRAQRDRVILPSFFRACTRRVPRELIIFSFNLLPPIHVKLRNTLS